MGSRARQDSDLHDREDPEAAESHTRRPATPTQFVHYKAADLKGFVDTLKRGETIKFPSVHRGDHQFQNISHRAKSSASAELHKNWADLYYVLDGEVTIRYGDRLEGGKEGDRR